MTLPKVVMSGLAESRRGSTTPPDTEVPGVRSMDSRGTHPLSHGFRTPCNPQAVQCHLGCREANNCEHFIFFVHGGLPQQNVHGVHCKSFCDPKRLSFALSQTSCVPLCLSSEC